MKKAIVKHCKHCKNLAYGNYCALRNHEIEKPNWTTCKSWNSSEDRGGPLFSIVFDEYKHCAIPYWNGNRPEPVILAGYYPMISINIGGKETLFDHCEDYAKHFSPYDLMDRPVMNVHRSRPPTKQEVQDLERDEQVEEITDRKKPDPIAYDFDYEFQNEFTSEPPFDEEFRKMVEERLKKFR